MDRRTDIQEVDFGDMVSTPSYSPYSAPWMPSSTTDYMPKMAQRKAKRLIPDGEKDNKYWEKRKRNNMAAKKSRESKRQIEAEVRHKVSLLEEDNALLKREMAILKAKFGIPVNQCILTAEERSQCMKEVKAMQAVDPDTTCTASALSSNVLAPLASGSASANTSGRNPSPNDMKHEDVDESEAEDRIERNIPSMDIPNVSAISPHVTWTSQPGPNSLFQYPHLAQDYYTNGSQCHSGREDSYIYSNRLTQMSQQHDYNNTYHNQLLSNRKLPSPTDLSKSSMCNDSDEENDQTSVNTVSSTCAHFPGDLLASYSKHRHSPRGMESALSLQHRDLSHIDNCETPPGTIQQVLHSIDERRRQSHYTRDLLEEEDSEVKRKLGLLSARMQKMKQFTVGK